MMSTGSPGSLGSVTAGTAALRLTGLAVAVTVLVILRSPLTVAIGVVGLVTIALVAGLGIRGLLRSVRPLRWIALLMIGFHVIVGQASTTAWADAITITGTLLVTVALAGCVTATTPSSAILDAVERALGPLRHVRVDPARIALVFALALRSVPVLHHLATGTRDAARARGVERSVRAQVVPLEIGRAHV